jgi:PAS domain S-box-containing protein
VDISQRKAASEALTRSEEQFRVLAQTVPDIVFTADPSGLVEYLNPRWFELTGLSADDSKGAGWRCAVAPADAAAVAAAWQAAIATGEAMRLEARLRSTGGGERWHQIHGLPLRDGTGEIKQWVGTLADIDDLKRAEQELAIVAADLARSNRELENFAYVASHDLQEPLRTIAGHLQLIEKECRERLDSDAMVSIGFVIDGAKRMKTLINDLLTYSRVQTRSRELAPTDVGQLLSSVIGDLTVAIDESKAQVSFDPMPVVQADASQLEMTLRNLLANAIKFRGTQPPRIHIGVREADDEITFTVQDNGIGIEPQYWQRIFEIFQRLHTLDEYPGTGIGLAVCKCVVERHGGRIWVDSSPGRGSTFLFTIPRNPKARKHDVHRH